MLMITAWGSGGRRVRSEVFATLDPVSKSQAVDREKMMEDENNEQYLTDVGMERC